MKKYFLVVLHMTPSGRAAVAVSSTLSRGAGTAAQSPVVTVCGPGEASDHTPRPRHGHARQHPRPTSAAAEARHGHRQQGRNEAVCCQVHRQARAGTVMTVARWRSSRVPDLQSVGRGFKSQPPRCRVQPWASC